MIIAIDGPAGAGKSSTAKELAKILGIKYFDSGAVYRALTYLATNQKLADNEELKHFSASLKLDMIKLDWTDGFMQVILNGKNVTHLIRSPEITASVGRIANDPGCRAFVNGIMHQVSSSDSLVIDGRDIGSLVFPDADFKFFLDATAQTRTQRRALETGIPLNSNEFDELLAQINNRDKADRERAIAPLIKADDAFLIDSSSMNQDEVIQMMLRLIEGRSAN